MVFKDRKEAAKLLSEKLAKFKNRNDVIVLGLPRGGVILAHEIAKVLHAPLDLIVPRKIGAPMNPEFAIGAIAEDGEGVFDEEYINEYGVSREYIEKTVREEMAEAARRLSLYRGGAGPLDLAGKIALLVDDGIATGATMRAAIKSAWAKGAKSVVCAVPTGARDSVEKIKQEASEVICLDCPLFFGAVGAFYEEFPQVSDNEVIELMKN